MAQNDLLCTDVPLWNQSVSHSLTQYSTYTLWLVDECVHACVSKQCLTAHQHKWPFGATGGEKCKGHSNGTQPRSSFSATPRGRGCRDATIQVIPGLVATATADHCTNIATWLLGGRRRLRRCRRRRLDNLQPTNWPPALFRRPVSPRHWRRTCYVRAVSHFLNPDKFIFEEQFNINRNVASAQPSDTKAQVKQWGSNDRCQAFAIVVAVYVLALYK